MKRNKKTRCAAMLFTLCLVTTSIVGGTFAKYTTTGEASDTARVAKFGVVIKTSGSLFSNAYLTADNNKNGNEPTQWSIDDADYGKNKKRITVAASSDDDNIVAPGTKSASGLTFGISGKPEVATKIIPTIKTRDIYLSGDYTYGVMTKTDVVTEENFSELVTNSKLYVKDDNGYTLQTEDDSYDKDNKKKYYQLHDEVTVTDDYFPVVYSLTGETSSEENGVTKSSTDAVAKALITTIAGKKVAKNLEPDDGEDEDIGLNIYQVDEDDLNIFDANTDLSENLLGDETLSWEWVYETEDDDSEVITQYDKQDTILGDMIAAKGVKDKDAEYFVVAKSSTDDTSDYSDVVYTDNKDEDNGDGYVLLDNEIIASIITSFNITLTVTQVD